MTTPFEELIARVDTLEQSRAQDMTLLLSRFDDLEKTTEQHFNNLEKLIGMLQEQVGWIAKVVSRRFNSSSDTNYERTGEPE